MTVPWRLRAAVLTLIGVLAVHRARFLFAAPEHEHELAGAHVYLTWLTPVAGVLLFLAVVELAAQLGRLDDAAVPRLPRARVLWPAVTVTLLGVFGVQESVETYFSHGHWPEVADLLAGGGWTAVPAALIAGGAIALLLRGAATVVSWALGRSRSRRRSALAVAIPDTPSLARRGSVLARRLAGRAPPALS